MKSLEINLISYEKQLCRYFNSASNFSSVVFLVCLTEYLLSITATDVKTNLKLNRNSQFLENS